MSASARVMAAINAATSCTPCPVANCRIWSAVRGESWTTCTSSCGSFSAGLTSVAASRVAVVLLCPLRVHCVACGRWGEHVFDKHKIRRSPPITDPRGDEDVRAGYGGVEGPSQRAQNLFKELGVC